MMGQEDEEGNPNPNDLNNMTCGKKGGVVCMWGKERSREKREIIMSHHHHIHGKKRRRRKEKKGFRKEMANWL